MSEPATPLALAEPTLTEDVTLHVLKQDDLFAVFNARGDFHGEMHAVGPSMGADGLFQDDTRVLSRLSLSVAGLQPRLLSSSVGRDNVVFTANLSNPALIDRQGYPVAADQLHIGRRRFLWRRKLYESFHIESFNDARVVFDLVFDVEADFRDVFEIRGAARQRRGRMLDAHKSDHAYIVGYRGLDGRVRRTALSFSRDVAIQHGRIVVPVDIAPKQSWRLNLTIASDGDASPPTRTIFFTALKGAKRQMRRKAGALDRMVSSNATFDAWIARASSDLALLVTELETGPYPYAGIPWFSVPFGRDAVITALQVLWVEPTIARGVLAFLSAAQAAEESAFSDAQPGKIMHETRKGEMATLQEVPFARYYGGVDTTPLFVLLAGAYFRRTDDLDFIRGIWPAVHAALAWIDLFGDHDGDGFVEYLRGEATGLQNQGWKDSGDSIFHSDGRLAEGPIALIEVQAYVAAAKQAAAPLARAVGDEDTARKLEQEAAELRLLIERKFWSERLGTYVLALDGAKRPCEVRASNPAHALYCGVASHSHARRIGEQIMSPAFFTGWGIRTLAEGEQRYNPISYHNGTVWPHDCAIAAAGLARYGMSEQAGRIFTGLFEAASLLPHLRLPELFCGFRRRAGEGPVAYPSACTPQAWASGAPFLLLRACLGIDIDAAQGVIEISGPHLPAWLDELHVREIAIGEARASLYFRRVGNEVEAGVTEATGGVSLVRGFRQFVGYR